MQYVENSTSDLVYQKAVKSIRFNFCLSYAIYTNVKYRRFLKGKLHHVISMFAMVMDLIICLLVDLVTLNNLLQIIILNVTYLRI